jgi:hypothetical protein
MKKSLKLNLNLNLNWRGRGEAVAQAPRVLHGRAQVEFTVPGPRDTAPRQPMCSESWCVVRQQQSP